MHVRSHLHLLRRGCLGHAGFSSSNFVTWIRPWLSFNQRIRLIIDATLYESFLNGIVSCFKGRRICPRLFGARQHRVLVKIRMACSSTCTEGRKRSRDSFQKSDRRQTAHIGFAKICELPTRFVVFFGCEALLQALQSRSISASEGCGVRARVASYVQSIGQSSGPE